MQKIKSSMFEFVKFYDIGLLAGVANGSNLEGKHSQIDLFLKLNCERCWIYDTEVSIKIDIIICKN